MNTPSRALICCRYNRKGTGQFTFISLNSLNSSWREERGCKMNEKNEQRIFNSKNKSVTIKGAQRINVPVSAGFWYRQQNRNGKKKGKKKHNKNEKFILWAGYTYLSELVFVHEINDNGQPFWKTRHFSFI